MVERAAELRRAGLTVREIADEVGRSTSGISKLLMRAVDEGLMGPPDPRGPGFRPKLSQSEREYRRAVILRMRGDGATNAQIAEMFGVTAAAVGAEIRRMRTEGIHVAPRHTRDTRPVSETERRQRRSVIAQRRAEGVSGVRIAQELGLAPSSVYREIRQMRCDGIAVP